MVELIAHTVLHQGVPFPVIEGGQGDPLLLLHGGGSRAAHFEPLMRELASSFRVIAYDQRGFGSNCPPADAAIDHPIWANDVLGILDALGIERASVLGWSLGCPVAINATVLNPDRIRALILIGAPDPNRAVNVTALRARQADYAALTGAALRNRVRTELAAQLAPGFADSDTLLESLVSDRMASTPAMQSRVIEAYPTRPNLVAAANSVHKPALILTGEHDKITTPESGLALASALGNGTQEIVPGVGHYMAAERPDLLAKLITARLPELLASTKARP